MSKGFRARGGEEAVHLQIELAVGKLCVGRRGWRWVDLLLYLILVPTAGKNKRVIGRRQIPEGQRAATQALGRLLPSPDSTMSLFTPDDPWNTSRLFRFLREVNGKHGLQLESYEDLHQWSTTHIDLFWSHVWDHTGIIGSKGARVVDATVTPAANPAWFCDSAINFAENLLSNRSPEVTAVVQVCTLSPMYARSSWHDLACSGTNFPESQARTRPSLQRAALLARRRRGLCLSPVRACPR